MRKIASDQVISLGGCDPSIAIHHLPLFVTGQCDDAMVIPIQPRRSEPELCGREGVTVIGHGAVAQRNGDEFPLTVVQKRNLKKRISLVQFIKFPVDILNKYLDLVTGDFVHW